MLIRCFAQPRLPPMGFLG